MIDDGMIPLGSADAKELGFTPDLFDGYLWKHGDLIIISLIISKQPGQGNLGRLFDTIWRHGYTIHVPTPSKRMTAICEAKGFEHKAVWDEAYQDAVEIYEGLPGLFAAGETAT